MILENDFLVDLINGDPAVDDSPYTVVVDEQAGEWRWGIEWRLILSDEQGRFWQTYYRTQSGDVYYNSLEEESVSEFVEVEPYQVSITDYRPKS